MKPKVVLVSAYASEGAALEVASRTVEETMVAACHIQTSTGLAKIAACYIVTPVNLPLVEV
jgi:hypothetical protein